MMKQNILLLTCLATAVSLHAQTSPVKVSGVVQAQYQIGERDATLKVGTANAAGESAFNRFGIRRGRVKLTYDTRIAAAVFQTDMSEKGVVLKDAYLDLKAPWRADGVLRAGVFSRPFGYEVDYSTTVRESPERSRTFESLFPDDRDIGAMVSIRILPIAKLELGLFTGNGAKQETDNRKDFIGRLPFELSIGRDAYAFGVSYYRGSVYQGTANVYRMEGDAFVLDDATANLGGYAKREYIGFDARATWRTRWGTTKLIAEYIFGTQPGTRDSNRSPNAAALPTSDTYIRPFGGGYVMLTQSVGDAPVSFVAKYDRYDPNTRIASARINGKGDVAYDTFGLGALWSPYTNIRLLAYYDMNFNEHAAQLGGYEIDRDDDAFTLQLQYKF
jgi:hypothetical protein